MKDFDKRFVIKTMSELLAYEIYYNYQQDKDSLIEINKIYNSLDSHLFFTCYKDEILSLGTKMAEILYNVPLTKKEITNK